MAVGAASCGFSADMGTGKSRIVEGEPDDRIETVALYKDTGTGFWCSGTVIADRWVLTASHCFTGAIGKSPHGVAPYYNTFNQVVIKAQRALPSGELDPTWYEFVKPEGKPEWHSEPSFVRMGHRRESDLDRSIDVALVHMPVSLSMLKKAKVGRMGGNPACPDAPFTARVVGFGKNDNPYCWGLDVTCGWEGDPGSTGLVSPIRRGNWLDDTEPHNVEGEEHRWEWTAGLFHDYMSVAPGDSGGSLFWETDPTHRYLCGVNQGNLDLSISTAYIVGTSIHAAVDRGANLQWIRDVAWEGDPVTGHFKGDCKPSEGDPDGDGVFGTCDNCASVFNPFQEDTDSDGIGNACDNCPSVPNRDQRNSNLQYEMSIYGGQLPPCATGGETNCTTSFPLTTPAVFPATPATSNRVGVRAAFYPGDSCDEPIAPINLGTESVTDLIPASHKYTCNKILRSVSGGDTVEAGALCDPIVKNSLTLDGLAPEESHGFVRVLRCQCALPTESLCALNECQRGEVLFPPPTTVWGKMTVRKGGAPSPENRAAPYEDLMGLEFKPNKSSLDLAALKGSWDYWADITVPSTTPWRGFVWSWVKNYDPGTGMPAPAGITAVAAPSLLKLRQSWQFVSLTEEKPAEQIFWSGDLRRRKITDFGDAFPGIDPESRRHFIEVLHRETDVVVIHTPGAGPVDVTTHVSPTIRLALTEESSTVVALASDAAFHRTTNYLGAIVEPTTHRVTAAIRASSGDLVSDPLDLGPAVPQTGTSWPHPDKINENIGPGSIGYVIPAVYAVSRHRPEIAFFGEVDETGEVGRHVRLVNLYNGTQRRARFYNDLAIPHPLSVTYRAEDDAYYVLARGMDENGSFALDFWRIDRGLTPQLMHRWAMGALPNTRRYWISTAFNGSLILTTNGPNGYHVAQINMWAEGPRVVRRLHGATALRGPAAVFFNGTYLEPDVSPNGLALVSPGGVNPTPIEDKPFQVFGSDPFEPELTSLWDMF